MRIRDDFVTNSSSTSFVLRKAGLTEKEIQLVKNVCEWVSAEELSEICNNVDVNKIYYLVDYEEDNAYMHIWVSRDEAMNDREVDKILWKHDCGDVSPKFDRHY